MPEIEKVEGIDAEKEAQLKAKIDAVEGEKIEAVKSKLSTKERLERRLIDLPIDIMFEDSEGEFPVQVRRLSTKENDRLVDIQNIIGKLETKAPTKESKKQYDDLMDEMFKLFGEICLDPELNYEYWSSKSYSPDVFVTVMLRAMAKSTGISEAEMRNIKSFRGK